MPVLESRYFECDSLYEDCRSGWDYYGRWIVLAIIIGVAFLVFFLWACYSSRRRRRMGMQPFRGTGWVGGRRPAGQYQPQQPYYNPAPPQNADGTYNAPPPQYQGPSPGYYNQGQAQGQNQGYFGGQQSGVELQQPQNAYHAGENVYAPPPGPPPAK